MERECIPAERKPGEPLAGPAALEATACESGDHKSK